MQTKKISYVFSMVVLSLGLMTQAEAGKRAKSASKDGRPKYRVRVQLNSSDEKGTAVISQQDPAVPTVYNDIKTCRVSGGNIKPGSAGFGGAGDWIHNKKPEKDKAIKSPRGSFWVADTTDSLWYKGKWSPGYNNAVYITSKGGNPVALHSGSLDENSHGCIRNDCAGFIRAKADETAEACSGNSQILPAEAGKPCRKFSMLVDVI